VEGQISHIIHRFIKKGILLHLLPIMMESDEILAYMMNNNQFPYDYVILSGGDGTIKTFVTLMFNHNINVPIGIIPTGTCNDFARCLDIPQGLDECIDIILDGKTNWVDLGKVNENDYFVDTCAGGLFVEASVKTPSIYKRNFGPLAYYIHGLSEIATIKPFEVSIETNGITMKENILLFLILNGNHGAGFEDLISDADLSDGNMNIILIKDCTYVDLANLLFKLLNKNLISDPHVIRLPIKNCTISGKRSPCITLDGEEGASLPLNIEVLHNALQVFVR